MEVVLSNGVKKHAPMCCFLIFSSLLLSTCGRKSNGDDKLPAPSILAPGPTADNFLVSRLAPEQMFKQLQSSLGVTLGYSTDSVFYSTLSTEFAIPLGGVDFIANVRTRDGLDKVQTVLVARTVAWLAATELISVETSKPPAVFTRANIKSDVPEGSTLESWNNQLDEIYLRIFARKPSNDERSAVRKTFQSVNTIQGGDTENAWQTVVYALLSTSEAWHVWR